MATRTRSLTTGREIPTDLSPTGKLVYLYLAERGRATATELKHGLDIPQLRLYPVLASLERDDRIELADGEYRVPR